MGDDLNEIIEEEHAGIEGEATGSGCKLYYVPACRCGQFGHLVVRISKEDMPEFKYTPVMPVDEETNVQAGEYFDRLPPSVRYG